MKFKQMHRLLIFIISIVIYFYANVSCAQNIFKGLFKDKSPRTVEKYVSKGKYEKAIALIKDGASFDTVEVVKLALDERDISVDQSKYNKKNKKLMDFIKFLVANKKTDPNLASSTGFTLAMFASAYGEMGLLKTLLKDKKFNPNLQDNKGWTTAMYAVAEGKLATVKLIMQNESFDPNIVNDEGNTLGMLALKYQPSNGEDMTQEIMNLFLQHKKINPNVQNKNGNTLAIFAVEYNKPELVKKIVQHKDFVPNIINNNGSSLPIFTILKIKNVTIVIELLKEMKAKGENLLYVNPRNSLSVLWHAPELHPAKFAKYFYKIISDDYIKNVLSDLAKIAQIDPAVYHCDAAAPLRHRKKIRGPDKSEEKCSICHSSILTNPQFDVRQVYSPGSCDCQICLDCIDSFCDDALSKPFLARCPIHDTIIPMSFFLEAEVSPEKRHDYHFSSLRKSLEKVKGFTFCPTLNCVNGKVLSNISATEFECDLCDQKNVLLKVPMVKEMPDLMSDVHPCPHCSEFLTKDEKCNHVTCGYCKKRWNFKWGKRHVEGQDDGYTGSWNLQTGGRSYLVPGDKRKDGPIVEKYEELDK